MLITISCALTGHIPPALLVDCTITGVLLRILCGCCCAAQLSGQQWASPPTKSGTPTGTKQGRDRVKRPRRSDQNRPQRTGQNPPAGGRRQDSAPRTEPGPAGGPQVTYTSARPGMAERGRHAFASLDIRARRPLTPREWMEPDASGPWTGSWQRRAYFSIWVWPRSPTAGKARRRTQQTLRNREPSQRRRRTGTDPGGAGERERTHRTDAMTGGKGPRPHQRETTEQTTGCLTAHQ